MFYLSGSKKTIAPPIRLEYPVWDYWDDYDPQVMAQNPLPMIVFDLDGTLLDSHDMSLEGRRRVMERLGLPPVSPEVLDTMNDHISEQTIAALGLPPSRMPDFERHAREVDKELIPGQAKLYRGVRDMLETLYNHASLCLLTNGSPHYVEEVAHVTGIAQYFDHIQGFVPGMHKARRLSIWKNRHQPARMMMVGDRVTDIESAHAAGALAVGVLYGAGTLEEMTDADMIAQDVSELRRICLAFCEV